MSRAYEICDLSLLNGGTDVMRSLAKLAFSAAVLIIIPWPMCGEARAEGRAFPQAPPPPAQAMSQTGLLPVFAVDMDIDSSWVDGDSVPSPSPQFGHNGVSDTLDGAWAALRPDGFNVVRFTLQLDDPKSPSRLANLCLWAKANNLTLIPELIGSADMRRDKAAMSATISAFIVGTVTKLRAADPTLASYAQIAFYQIEGPTNHAGLYPGLSRDAAQQLLLAASDALRQSETQALQGTGIAATPISISASFDFELVQQGAAGSIALDPAAEQKAQASLTQFLAGFAASSNIDAINVEWFPGSLTPGDVSHFSGLLRALKTNLPNKQMTLSTGFSTAFNPTPQQLQFYTVTISNLADYRASEGAASNFVGVVFRRAFKGPNADLPAPAGLADPSTWDWNQRAKQLSAMWSQGTNDAEMTWWVSKVQDNMGLVALQAGGTGATVLPLPGQQAFQQISATMTQVSQTVQTPAGTSQTVTSVTVANATQGSGPGTAAPAAPAPDSMKQMLMTLLAQFTQQMTTQLAARLNAPRQPAAPAGYAYPPPPAATPAPGYAPVAPAPAAGTSLVVGPQDVSVDTISPVAGQPVSVSAQLHNQSQNQDLSGLTVEVVNAATGTYSAQSIQSGVVAPHATTTAVQLSWAPDATSAGAVQLVLQVLDPNGQLLASAPLPTITVPSTPSAAVAQPPNATPVPEQNGVAVVPAVSQPAPAPQISISYFGPSGSTPAPAGQIPEFSAQVSNPSATSTQAGQAQLMVDGTAQQTQPFDAMLPNGSHAIMFPASQATAGPHSLQLVVTTSDGANASATATATVASVSPSNASSPSGGNASAASLPPLQSASSGGTTDPRRVRTAVPSTFRIGNTTWANGATAPATAANPPAVRTSPAGQNTSGLSVQTTANNSADMSNTNSTNTSFAPPASTPPRRSARTLTATTQPNAGPSTDAVSTGTMGGSTVPAIRSAPRTITPGSSNANSVPFAPLNSTNPQPAAVNAGSTSSGAVAATNPTPATRAAMRTITPNYGSNSGPVASAPNQQSSTAAAPVASASSENMHARSDARVPNRSIRTITPTNANSSSPLPQTTQPPISPSTTAVFPASPSNGPPPARASVRTFTPQPNAPPTNANIAPPATGNTNVRAVTAPTRTITPGLPITDATAAIAPGTSQQFPANRVPRTALQPARGLPAGGSVDLSVASQDIHVIPAEPRAGQAATFTALIRNLGAAPETGATVLFTLLENGRPVQSSQPVPLSVAPSGQFQASWSSALPSAASLQIVVTVSAKDDANATNNQAAFTFSEVGTPATQTLKPLPKRH